MKYNGVHGRIYLICGNHLRFGRRVALSQINWS